VTHLLLKKCVQENLTLKKLGFAYYVASQWKQDADGVMQSIAIVGKKKGNAMRDYKKEYREYHSKPEQIENRSQRNKARRTLEAQGRVQKGDGRDVNHKTPIKRGGGNSPGNLEVTSKKSNRGWRKGKSDYNP